ncbi:MAG: magnesium/cobalt transporter CorA [Gemmataceae bacterium]|nr:magnesium/cobalt transporter CorA [Gemmataceae bacterium]
MITIFHWQHASKTLDRVLPEALPSLRADILAKDDVVWIDLDQPTADEEQAVFDSFFHPHTLTIEDIVRLRREPDALPHLPKVEEFPDYLFVIVNPLTRQFLDVFEKSKFDAAAPDQTLTQLSAVLTHDILITHHAARLECIDQVRAYIGRHQAQIERGPDYVFHLILDNTVDEFAGVLDRVESSLDDLESVIVGKPAPSFFLHLLRLKRQIIVLRKTLIAEREVLVRLSRGEFELVNAREMVYYRNVYDHLVRFTELIENSREMASDLMQIYLSAQANHLNQIMKLLTMISTIVLPMTLISGIYGMNFDRLLPTKENSFGFEITLGMMAVSGAVSLGVFWWRRWL